MRRRGLEVPHLVVREVARLLVDLQVIVERDEHVVGRLAPRGDLGLVDLQQRREIRVALRGARRPAQVPLSHEVRERVVVGDRGVLVRAGDAVDAEVAAVVVVAERPPHPRRLDEQLQADLALEVVVARHRAVALAGGGDVGPRWKAAVPAGQ